MNISASYWWEVIKVKLRGKLWIKPGRGQGYKEFFFFSLAGRTENINNRERKRVLCLAFKLWGGKR